MEPVSRGESDPGGALDRALEILVDLQGLRRCAVLDRSGRILGHRGFPSRGEATETASLVAGIHASGGRLSQLLGETRPARIRTLGESRETLVLPLTSGGDPLLLFLLMDAPTDGEALRGALEEVGRVLGSGAVASGREVTAEGFEESLTESLDRLFPSEGDPGSP